MGINLDHQVLSRPSSTVIERMNYYYSSWPPIPADAGHLCEWLGAPEHHFFLTSGGAEAALQLFIDFYLEEIRETGRNYLLTSVIEEAPILLSMSRMEELGCAAVPIPIDQNGALRLDALDEALKPKASLISLSWANPLTGVLQPIHEIIQRCHAKGVKVHINGSHVIGKLPISLDEWGIDFFSFDGDKIHTPSGIGGLLQRMKRDSSSHPAALAGLSLAVEEELYRLGSFALETARLRDTFESELKIALPDTALLFQDADRLPHISAVAFPGVMSEALLYALHRKQVYATIGGGQFQKLSSQLKTCRLAGELCHSAISFAISHETTEDDLAHALDVIVSSVRKLSTLSACL